MNLENMTRRMLHFTPVVGWMNDPNGLIFLNEYYHIFYQYDPSSIVHGRMHWGHARTKDFIQWEEMPIALYPDENGEIYSGCIVKTDASCLSDNTDFPKDGLIAVYTKHVEQNGIRRESQYISVSRDEGVSFDQDSTRCVLDLEKSDFRDPQVFFCKKTKRWIMLLEAGQKLLFFSSRNLQQWSFESEFLIECDWDEYVVECPNLHCFASNGGETWALIFGVNQNCKDSITAYYTGDFDGTRFVNSGEWRILDFGPDHFASSIFAYTQKQTLLLGWMSNWNYANHIPARDTRGKMTFPRELRAEETREGTLIAQRPLNVPDRFVKSRELILAEVFELETGEAHMISGYMTGAKSELLLTWEDGWIRITVFPREGRICMERSTSLSPVHNAAFDRRTGCFTLRDTCDIVVLLDVNSIEVFAADGVACGTMLYFSQTALIKATCKGFLDGVVVDTISLDPHMETEEA